MSWGWGCSSRRSEAPHTGWEGVGVEGSCRYCDFCSTAKMGLCGQRRIWDKAGLPPFYGRPRWGWALESAGGGTAGAAEILWNIRRASLLG